jgi:hypothetical protein
VEELVQRLENEWGVIQQESEKKPSAGTFRIIFIWIFLPDFAISYWNYLLLELDSMLPSNVFHDLCDIISLLFCFGFKIMLAW